MSTAEFIIGHSADDAAERKQEARKILWAFLAAIFIHLVIGSSLAVFGRLLSPPLVTPEEDKPVELSFVDLAATPPPTKNTPFIENDESKKVPAPTDKTFESNANSIAASQDAASGSLPLPSQQGKDRPNIDLDSHQYSLPVDGARPQPSAAQQPSATPQASVQPTPLTKSEEFAMLTKTPTPRPSVAEKPQPPQSSYRPFKEKTHLAGAISNHGIASVNALGTPLGRYQKMLYDAIGSRWYPYTQAKADVISIGTATIIFSVDRNGRVNKRSLKVIQNTSNEAFADVCLQSILEIQLPPIPDDVADSLPAEGLESEITFTMAPN